MSKLRILLLLAGLCLLPLGLQAQSRAEKSQYGKIVKKPTLKAAEKFLGKFPTSVYAPQVLRLRDSLLYFALDPEDAAGVKDFVAQHPDSPFRPQADERIRRHNSSTISREEALRLAGDCLDAIGWKKDNIEHVLALDRDLTLRRLSPQGQLEGSSRIPAYSLSQLPVKELAEGLAFCAPLGKRSYLHFAHRNGQGEEYVETLYLPEEDVAFQALFYGKLLEDGRLEGQSPEGIEGLSLSPEVAFLVGRFRDNPRLLPLSKADYLSDTALQWWLERNPKAATAQAVKLSFGKLDSTSSLAEAFEKAKKEKGKSYNVARVNLRGHVALVAAAKKGGEPLLIWCEALQKGKELRSFYFENDGTTLDVVFYQGRSTYKLKISLADQTLRRLR